MDGTFVIGETSGGRRSEPEKQRSVGRGTITLKVRMAAVDSVYVIGAAAAHFQQMPKLSPLISPQTAQAQSGPLEPWDDIALSAACAR